MTAENRHGSSRPGNSDKEPQVGVQAVTGRGPLAAAGVVIAVAVALRLLGLDGGLPFIYDPDEPDFVNRAFRMVQTGDMNPGWFGHPGTTTIYGFWLAFSAYAVGWPGSADELAAAFGADPSAFYLLARGVVAAFGGATVVLTWLLARRIIGPWPSVFAAALLGLGSLHTQFSRVARPDIQMAFFALACVWFAVSIASTSRWRDYLSAGFLLGLAVATKYPALIFAAVILLAHGMRIVRTGLPWQADFPRLLGAGAATILGAFAGSPYLFISLPTALANIAFEARSYHLSGTSSGFWSSLGWYLSGPMTLELGIFGSVLALVGVYDSVRRRDPGRVVVLGACVLFLVFISTLSLRWDRWVIPAVPLACVLAGGGAGVIAGWVGRFAPPRVAPLIMAVAGLIALWPAAMTSVPWTVAAARDESRDQAWRWIMANVPAGSRILAEAYTPQLPAERYRLYTVTDGQIWRLDNAGRIYAVPRGVIGTLLDAAAVERAGIDYVVLANHYERRLAEANLYRREITVYDNITNAGELVFQAIPAPYAATGLPVRVYRLRR